MASTRKHLRAGDLRHLVQIQEPITFRDTIGDVIHVWSDVGSPVYASIQYLSARELIAAQAVQSEVIARITIRYQPGLKTTMRVVHGNDIYNIHGILRDQDSGIEYLTIPVSQGLDDGR